jgi:hypothetical protein
MILVLADERSLNIQLIHGLEKPENYSISKKKPISLCRKLSHVNFEKNGGFLLGLKQFSRDLNCPEVIMKSTPSNKVALVQSNQLMHARRQVTLPHSKVSCFQVTSAKGR